MHCPLTQGTGKDGDVSLCAVYGSDSNAMGRGHLTLRPTAQQCFNAASRALKSPRPTGHAPFKKMSLYRPMGTALYGTAVGPRKCRNKR